MAIADSPEEAAADRFWLYDLEVEIVATDRPMIGTYKAGDRFWVEGEVIRLPPGQGFSLYALAALLPLLPAKQRETHPADWMTTDVEIAGPDPHCGARYRIRRLAKRWFRHAETTAVPMPAAGQPAPERGGRS
jgi:uncharacterized repeat protein (TIGR04076 family)